jgi:hypothetical protein
MASWLLRVFREQGKQLKDEMQIETSLVGLKQEQGKNDDGGEMNNETGQTTELGSQRTLRKGRAERRRREERQKGSEGRQREKRVPANGREARYGGRGGTGEQKWVVETIDNGGLMAGGQSG